MVPAEQGCADKGSGIGSVPPLCRAGGHLGGALGGVRDPQHRQSLPRSPFQSPGEAGRTRSLVPAGRVWVLCPSVSPCPLVPAGGESQGAAGRGAPHPGQGREGEGLESRDVTPATLAPASLSLKLKVANKRRVLHRLAWLLCAPGREKGQPRSCPCPAAVPWPSAQSAKTRPRRKGLARAASCPADDGRWRRKEGCPQLGLRAARAASAQITPGKAAGAILVGGWMLLARLHTCLWLCTT